MPQALKKLQPILSNCDRHHTSTFLCPAFPFYPVGTIVWPVMLLGCWMPMQPGFANPVTSSLASHSEQVEKSTSLSTTIQPENTEASFLYPSIHPWSEPYTGTEIIAGSLPHADDWQSTALDSRQIILAGADNFNPALQLPPPSPEPFEVTTSSTPTSNDAAISLEGLTTDFRSDYDNFGQQNQFIEETARFRLRNDEALRVKTGFNTFQQRGVESIANIPLQVGWEGKWGPFKLRPTVGVDIFDRLSLKPNLSLEVETKIFRNITLIGVIEQAPYKFNAKTLNNEISAWRFGSNLFWQIDRTTSLFSLLRFGNYNDGNHEQQSFTRLERKFGDFFAAANLFNWSYDNDFEARSGYFSPPDFLVYNGEIGWQGDVFKFLRCRVAASLGRQRLNGEYSGARSYQARCTAKLSPNLDADFGYSFSDVQSRNTSGSGFNSQSISGQLRFKF